MPISVYADLGGFFLPRVLMWHMTVTYSSSDAEQMISVSILSMYRISLTTVRACVYGKWYCRRRMVGLG